MKTTNKFLFSTLSAAALFVLTINAQAQYKPVGEDGIAASPKVRQFLNERHSSLKSNPQGALNVTSVANRPSNQATAADGIAASPKLRETLAHRTLTTASPAESYAVGYTPTGSDGITASPKLRETLNERQPVFQIAPVK